MSKSNHGGRRTGSGAKLKPPGERYRTPVLQIGRVPVEIREELKRAAKRSGKTWTAWVTGVLLRAARRK